MQRWAPQGASITLLLTQNELMPQKTKLQCLISAPHGCGLNELSSVRITDQGEFNDLPWPVTHSGNTRIGRPPCSKLDHLWNRHQKKEVNEGSAYQETSLGNMAWLCVMLSKMVIRNINRTHSGEWVRKMYHYGHRATLVYHLIILYIHIWDVYDTTLNNLESNFIILHI